MPQQVNNVWGVDSQTEFITLPSGQTIYAKKMGMEAVLAAGLTSEMDILSQFVVKEHLKPQDHKIKGQQDDEPTVDVDAVMKDPELFGRLIMLMDKLIPEIVAKPSVHLHFEVLQDGNTTRKLTAEQREEINNKAGLTYIYTDTISIVDKMFLFEWATGQSSSDPRTFRERHKDLMGDVGDVKATPRKAVKSARSRQR